MASKQMEEIQRKLAVLAYPRANAPTQFLLFAGVERYRLLKWLFFHLAEIANFLGYTPSVDTEAIQGKGSYEDRVELLYLIVYLVEASCYADNPEWSVDEQLAKDVQLVDSIAEKQAQIFSEECKLFPADVQIQSIYPLPDIAELELRGGSERRQGLTSITQNATKM